MSIPRREHDQSRVFKKMGEAIGWSRYKDSNDKTYAEHTSAMSPNLRREHHDFEPGAGHVEVKGMWDADK
jgi:hypothetical protein